MDLRTALIAAALGFATTAALNSFWFGLRLRRFVLAKQRLASDLDLFRFKALVADQMRAALIQIVLLSAPVVIVVAGIVAEVLYPTDVLFVVVPAVVILAIAAYFRRWEIEARAIETATPELLEQRDAVVRTWLRKAWPDW
ncbi:MAG: hypothetical protein MUC56_05630 [Thermoanaerobaculales bacterium]|jgi:hypothetical protein|nr:hypothetical protein [Thermoanaerobaculales bacterium]